MSDERTIKPNAPADFTPQLGDYKTLQPFRYWCQKVLPSVYDDSLSYYELLCKVIDYLNKTMEDVETLYGDVTNLHTSYEQLQNYVNVYFSSLDVQNEINNKLDEMSNSGQLSNLFDKYFKFRVIYFNSVDDMKKSTTLYNENIVFCSGYHNANDNGGGFYQISNTLNDNVFNESCLNNLYAYLITLEDKVNIKRYGVTEDVECTNLFKNAINDAYLKNLTLFIPGGNYIVNELTAKCSIQGENYSNTIINFLSGSFTGDSENYNIFNGFIDNITIKGNTKLTSQNGFDMSILKGSISNCLAEYFTGVGFYMRPYLGNYQELVNTGEKHSVQNCTALRCKTGFILSTQDSFYTNIVSAFCETGLNCQNCAINNAHIWGYYKAGAIVGGRCRISNLEIEGATNINPDFILSVNNGSVSIVNLYLWNNLVNKTLIWLNQSDICSIENLIVGEPGSLHPDVDNTKLNLIGGTGNILYVSGSVNDIYTNGSLMNATVSKSIVNIIAKNMSGANTFDLLKNNINNKIGFTNYNFSVTNNTASHKIVDKTLTVFIYGGYIGSNNKVYSFYGCVSYNSCKIECESSNAIFSVTNGILTVADSTGLYLCNAKVLDTVYTG